MTLTEALIRAQSALQYRINDVIPLLNSPHLKVSSDWLQLSKDRDLEAIEVIEKELSHDS